MNKTDYKRLGDYIREVDSRNRDLAVTLSQGICNAKYFQNPKQVADRPETHKVVRTRQFAYNRATTRNGEKISIALRDGPDCTVSSAYQVFEVIDEEKLLPEYLMMWFRRPEFDRLAIYHSHGSAHEFFEWEAMCDVRLPIPPISRQREIVAEYETLTRRIRLNERLISTLESAAQTLYRRTFVDNIDPARLPPGWRTGTLSEIAILITKGTTPPEMSKTSDERLVKFIKGEAISDAHCIDAKMLSYIDEETHSTILKRSIIERDDILFSIAGTLGKFALVGDTHIPANTNQAVAIIRTNKEIISPVTVFSFFLAGFHADYCSRNIQQAVQANLSLGTISGIPVLLPPKDVLERYEVDVGRVLRVVFMKRRENEKLREMLPLLLSSMGN